MVLLRPGAWNLTFIFSFRNWKQKVNISQFLYTSVLATRCITLIFSKRGIQRVSTSVHYMCHAQIGLIISHNTLKYIPAAHTLTKVNIKSLQATLGLACDAHVFLVVMVTDGRKDIQHTQTYLTQSPKSMFFCKNVYL